MPTVTKQELVNRIAEQTQARQTVVKTIIETFLENLTVELANGNRIEFREFGVFETKVQPARTAQNPKTLEPVQVPAKRKIKFKLGRLMREGLNETT
mgnify:CR=1 FL=1